MGDFKRCAPAGRGTVTEGTKPRAQEGEEAVFNMR